MTRRAVLIAAFLAYCAVVVTGAVVHEPWWDEAQSWLIARDAPVADLFAHVLRYEGHPPLWYLILAVPAKLGAPYAAMKVVAALIGMITAAMILFAFPRVPLVVRVLAPFAFFFAYQWTVVARSYVLLPPIVLAIARIYDERAARGRSYTLLLLLLASVSVYGLAIACVLALLFAIETRRIPWLFAIGVAVLAAVLWPPPDRALRALVFGPFSLERHARVVSTVIPSLLWNGLEDEPPLAAMLATAFAILVLALYVAWLFRRGVGVPFALSTLAAYAIALCYYSEWHEGVFFLLLLSFGFIVLGRAREPARLDRLALGVLVLLLARHAYWTARSLAYDAAEPVTGSAAAARFLAALGPRRVFGAGQLVIEVQPYFTRSAFANDPMPAYWDWSPRNTWPQERPGPELGVEMDRWLGRQLARDPDVLVVASGSPLYAKSLRANPRYREAALFRATAFWKDRRTWTTAFRIFVRAR